MGITRGSVSNALAGVDTLGLAVYKVHGRGYRLMTPVQWLARERIIEHLGKQALRFDIDVLDQTGSTNTDLLERAMRGARSGSVLAAESQTQGRGRRGRDWHSSPGGALTFSMLWRFDQGAGFLSGLSLVVGIALARVLTGSLPAAVESLERRMILDALRRHHGNKTRAAAELKVSRRNLIRLVQKYGLDDVSR